MPHYQPLRKKGYRDILVLRDLIKAAHHLSFEWLDYIYFSRFLMISDRNANIQSAQVLKEQPKENKLFSIQLKKINSSLFGGY